jgi:hypothetical protein
VVQVLPVHQARSAEGHPPRFDVENGVDEVARQSEGRQGGEEASRSMERATFSLVTEHGTGSLAVLLGLCRIAMLAHYRIAVRYSTLKPVLYKPHMRAKSTIAVSSP